MKHVKHPLAAALVALSLVSSSPAAPSRQDAAVEIVAKYQTAPFAEVVAKLREELSRVKVKEDPAKVEARVRKEFGDFVLQDPNFTRHVWDVIEPVFRFSGKEKNYRLLILKTVDPVAFVDDNCLVVISTGLLMAANSEDALAGVVAHEQAHGPFAERTAVARRQLQLAQEQGNAAFAEQAREALNLIEYECDAVAALQLSAQGYNPLRYLELLEAVGVGVEIVRGVAHFRSASCSPEHETRKQVVWRLATPDALKVVYPTNRLLPLQAGIRRARGEK